MKLKFISLASGSSGNCFYLGTTSYGILIDAGIGVKKGSLIVIAARESATVVKMQDAMRDMQYCLRRLDMLENKNEQNS